ncbi:hypothetical protein FPRO06_01694 [Fusarium proliferatum]|nr:hypothetical protein FPRO06_01694 [Fusarium proliferatum]
MPRRNRPEDLDFEIHVDPSCLSDPMDDNDTRAPEEPKVEVETDHDLKNDSAQELDNDIDTTNHTDSPSEAKAEPTVEAKEEDQSTITPRETKEEAQSDQEASDSEADSEAESEPEAEPKEEAKAQVDTEDKPEEPIEEPATESEEVEAVPTTSEAEADTTATEPSLDDTKDNDEDHTPVEDAITTEDTPADTPTEYTPSADIPTDNIPAEDSTAQDPKEDEPIEEDKAKSAEADVEASTGGNEERHFSETESDRSGSRRESSGSSGSEYSSRRHSGRSEAISGVARDIASQIDNHEKRESLNSYSGTDDTGYISHSESVSTRTGPKMSTAGMRGGVDEAAENSSHHEHEDDVFSDRSPRSSMGSVSETDNRKAQDAMSRMTRSPRVSGVSGISGFSEYDREEEDFIPTIRGNPRPVFRSPSSVKAMQMSSPPGSTIGSPRSSRRAPLSASRLGSPRFSEQYSPKKTPPRFKRSTPPLVLLHVTLLPLRWPWGDVLENADADDLSKECKAIRDAWRLLQDRMADTTVERGILLPHPQSDYEVLEERLLEALDLPMRRRARILECGHYLGPSNEMTIEDSEEEESEEDEYQQQEEDERRSSRRSQAPPTHWCKTCKSDINYESLGRAKVFRVKVYASNGLIRGGAWEACWKEMERVDVEIEPLVDAVSQHELVSLEADQERELAMREAEEEERYIRLDEEHREFEERERGRLSRRRGESRNHVEDISQMSEGKSRMENHDASRHETSRHEDSRYDKSLHAESVHDKSAYDESLHEPSHHELSHHEPSHHDESLHDVSEAREASIHETTEDHDQSHIANDTQPAEEHSADVTKESMKEPADDVEESFAEDQDDEKSRSFEELEKDIDDHLQEERERSLAEEARNIGPTPEPSHLGDTNMEAEESSIAPEDPTDSKDDDAERLRREEERYREIYGDTPASKEHHQESQRSFHEQQPLHHEQHYAERSRSSAGNHAPDYAHAAPRVPTAEERRQAMKSATLPELLAESARVVMQDKKNILIGLLSVLILLLAIRGNTAPQQDPRNFQTVVMNREVPTVTVTQAISIQATEAAPQIAASADPVEDEEEERNVEVYHPEESIVVEDTPAQNNAAQYEQVNNNQIAIGNSYPSHDGSSTGLVDPCASCSAPSQGYHGVEAPRELDAGPAAESPETEKQPTCEERIVRIVETVTAVETATVKITEYATEVPSQETQAAEAIEEEKLEESAAPEAEDTFVAADAPVDGEAPVEETLPAEETVLPSNEAESVKEEEDPAQETVSPDEEALDEIITGGFYDRRDRSVGHIEDGRIEREVPGWRSKRYIRCYRTREEPVTAKVEEASVGPVARSQEENKEEDGAVHAWPIEEVGADKEEKYESRRGVGRDE